MTPLAVYSPAASWALILGLVVLVVLILAPLWPDRPPRPGVSDLASSAIKTRRGGDTRKGGAR